MPPATKIITGLYRWHACEVDFHSTAVPATLLQVGQWHKRTRLKSDSHSKVFVVFHLHSPSFTLSIAPPLRQQATSKDLRFEYVTPSEPQTGKYSSVTIVEHTHVAVPFMT